MDNKLNILIFLRKILKLYEAGEKRSIEKYNFLENTRLQFGFCWLIVGFGFTKEYETEIITELKKEIQEDLSNTLNHWYETPIYCKIVGGKYRINEDALQPRINHLKRTIARLEKELNIESSQSLELKKGKFND